MCHDAFSSNHPSSRPFRSSLFAIFGALSLCAVLGGTRALAQTATAPILAEALLYSTMPSTFDHSPAMAMDKDAKTYFKSVYGMGDGDDFMVLLSKPIPVESIRIATGDEEGQDLLTDGFIEVSADGSTFTKAGDFDKKGALAASLNKKPVLALRIRVNSGRSLPSLLIREIEIKSSAPIAHAQLGPGRGFNDISQAPDLAQWATKAESQMEAFWFDTQSLLYSDKFITPNKINIVYKTGPDVTPVAATGGGVMTVNSQWCRAHPEDTGLTVHEMAHSVQSMIAYNPVWLIEGIADYVRWIKFEPENYKARINVEKATYKDSYRTTATFLGWLELHYDSKLVTKLNHATRFGTYREEMFKEYCGKEVSALWAEFIADYKASPDTIVTPKIAPADRPRVAPTVAANASVPVDLAPHFDAIGIVGDRARFDLASGFDGGGAAYSAALLGEKPTYRNVTFAVGKAGAPNVVTAKGKTIALPAGSYKSLWLLGAAIEGAQIGQTLTVAYADGTTDTLYQNFSDWFQPQRYPGEGRGVRMSYRNLSDGSKDPRTFYAYAYGFAVNPAKTVKSVSLPSNDFVKIVGITLAK
jgi:hypothetical protein